MQAKIDSIQVSLGDEVKRGKGREKEIVKLLVSEKSLKRKLQLRSDDSQEIEDLQHRVDGAVGKERRSENIIKSLPVQLLSVRSDLHNYRQRLSPYTERYTVDIAHGFSDFLYSIGEEVQRFVEKQRKDIETTMQTDLKGNHAFLCSLDNKFCRPGPSS